jgi:lysophospholipid acyltransferase (LPLAT)-like uncharacterized protein
LKLPGLKYDSPVPFTRAQQLQLAVFPPVFGGALKLLWRLNRIEVRNAAGFDDTEKAHGGALIAFWHEAMHLAGCYFRGRNFHTLTSYSFDGELAARTIQYLGHEAVRGSSSRGGAEGLRELEKALLQIPAAGITLDGPRGPRRTAKKGIAVLALRTQLPVVPSAFVATRCRRLRSWDRLPVPKPFGSIVCAFGDPVPPPGREEEVEATRLTLEKTLNNMHAAIEAEYGVDTG